MISSELSETSELSFSSSGSRGPRHTDPPRLHVVYALRASDRERLVMLVSVREKQIRYTYE